MAPKTWTSMSKVLLVSRLGELFEFLSQQMTLAGHPVGTKLSSIIFVNFTRVALCLPRPKSVNPLRRILYPPLNGFYGIQCKCSHVVIVIISIEINGFSTTNLFIELQSSIEMEQFRILLPSVVFLFTFWNYFTWIDYFSYKFKY